MTVKDLMVFIQSEEKARRHIMSEGLIYDIWNIGSLILEKLQDNKTIAFCGNGGSSTLASHLAAEFVGKYEQEKDGLPAIAFNDIANITSLGNDYGYNHVFSRQVKAYLDEEDILMVFSTSGSSPNVVEAVKCANENNVITIALTGKSGGKLKDLAQYCIQVESDKTAITQSVHMTIGHLFCEIVDDSFKKKQEESG